MTEAIPSPFPHMQAMAAAGAASEAAKAKKEDEHREFIKTTCWCAGISVACFVGAILTFQLFGDRLSVRPRNLFDSREVGNVIKEPHGAVAGTFFIEIGSSRERMESTVGGKHLESLGWSGVCALPLPAILSHRMCRVVTLPVAGRDGVNVRVPDCSDQTGFNALMSKLFKVNCPHVNKTAVSIRRFLTIVDAPKVIDYLYLDNEDYLYTHQATNLDIIRNFPHGERCVRAWSIHGASIEQIKNVLEVGQGCKVHGQGRKIFARCPCSPRVEGANISHVTMPTHPESRHPLMRSIQPPDASKPSIHIHSAADGQSHKGSVVVDTK